MSKIISDIVHDANVAHVKYQSWRENGNNSSTISSVNYPAVHIAPFNSKWKIGDPVFGYRFNRTLVKGRIKEIDSEDRDGLYYFIKDDKSEQEGWVGDIYTMVEYGGVRSGSYPPARIPKKESLGFKEAHQFLDQESRYNFLG